MNRCTICKQIKLLNNFSKKNGGKDTQCKKCRSAFSAIWYLKNKKYKLEYKEQNLKAWRAKTKIWMDELKSGPCNDCGKSFHPCAMDFDHISDDKSFNVSTAASSHLVSKEQLLKEIAKCELVCASCHRVRTFNKRHGI